MLIDNVVIKVSGGKGGDGFVSFNKEKMSLGPVGGDGGNGGNVVFVGVSDIGALKQFRNKKNFKAEDGGNGQGGFRTGSNGKDLVLKVPVGTIIKNLNNKEEKEIIQKEEKIVIAYGGKGGKGNFYFRSSTNTSPRKFTKGKEGDFFEINLELKLIADIGLIGFPNAGKSSILNELTAAKSYVANYAFTTLEPHLGAYYELILADIPGLIDGASSGKGLGIKFLKHIERTETLFHLISAESTDFLNDYLTVRKELEKYNETVSSKKEYIFITKSDLKDKKDLKKEAFRLEKKTSKKVLMVSIYDYESIEEVKKILNQIKDNK